MLQIERLRQVIARQNHTLLLTFEDGYTATFDVRPLIELEAFSPLADIAEFGKIHNGGYFVEWSCGADLSADTLRARASSVDQ